MYSSSIIDNSRSIIDDFRVKLQLVVSFTIGTYNNHIFIVQATAVHAMNQSSLITDAPDK